MITFLTIIHVAACFALIAVVLLQSGKGAEMGASFGSSGSQSVFGASGGTTFLSKVTTGAAVIFMLTSLSLAYFSSQSGSSSIMQKAVKPAAQKQAAPPAPAGAPAQPMQAPAKAK